MNFRKGRCYREEPEINFIPLIDVLLVILIFLMITTTYSKVSALKINLPNAQGEIQPTNNDNIVINISSRDEITIGAITIASDDKIALLNRLKALAQAQATAANQAVIINADANSTHQAVVRVMEAAREAGLTQLTFAVHPSEFEPRNGG